MGTLVKPLSWILGIVLLLVGILGFFTTTIVVFDVNVLHSVVHLASGVVALLAAGSGYKASRLYLIVFGIIYGVVTLAGFLNIEPIVSLLNINSADNFLHLAIAAVCLVVGFGSNKA
jgi:hypothetical protein